MKMLIGLVITLALFVLFACNKYLQSATIEAAPVELQSYLQKNNCSYLFNQIDWTTVKEEKIMTLPVVTVALKEQSRDLATNTAISKIIFAKDNHQFTHGYLVQIISAGIARKDASDKFLELLAEKKKIKGYICMTDLSTQIFSMDAIGGPPGWHTSPLDKKLLF